MQGGENLQFGRKAANPLGSYELARKKNTQMLLLLLSVTWSYFPLAKHNLKSQEKGNFEVCNFFLLASEDSVQWETRGKCLLRWVFLFSVLFPVPLAISNSLVLCWYCLRSQLS
jgi:hypothetical protein